MTTDQLIANFSAKLEDRLDEVKDNMYRELECMNIRNLWLEVIIQYKKEELEKLKINATD